MQMTRVGAIASFGLTLQFVATLALVAVAFPQGGFTGLDALAESMAGYIAANQANRAPRKFPS